MVNRRVAVLLGSRLGNLPTSEEIDDRSDFTTLTRRIRLEEPVNTAKKITWLVQFLLARHRLVKSPLRLVGIGVSTLVAPSADQLLLLI